MRAPNDVRSVLVGLVLDPRGLLWRRWNWKSAACSSTIRSALFFSVNLSAGLEAAQYAAMIELAYRGVTSGFHGAVTQALRHAEPRWLAAAAALCVLPLAGHGLEVVVHWTWGTAHLGASIAASMALSVISTLFNLYAMQRGALIVADAAAVSLSRDLRRMPRLIGGFLIVPFRVLSR